MSIASPFPEAIQALREKRLPELMRLALEIKLRERGETFSLCSIVNAKSGKCSEDCSFCVQSSHYRTDAPVYPLLETTEILTAAKEAHEIGAEHFSIVTSGRGMTRSEIPRVAAIVAAIKKEVGIKVCASLGIQSRDDFVILKDAGLSRYHHNLETSERFFSHVVTTHTFQDRVATISAAQAAGLEVCAGGIFGLGETEEDRISMALVLRDLEVDSVPLNILIPLPGTPLADALPLAAAEILRSIALYRILLPHVPIRLAAGRETALRDFLSSALMAGADGMMIGGYLTVRGRQPMEDHRLVAEMVTLWEHSR